MRPIMLNILIFLFFLTNAQELNNKKVIVPKDYISSLNVVYTTIDQWKGKLDIYSNPVSKIPTPVIINIHGGGWNHGSKESQTGFNTFFEAGFAVVNIEYRLADTAPAPAAIEDVRASIAYIIKNAKDLNIDPNKIVIMGGSAGAHLALMGGLLGNNKKFDQHCLSVENMKVAAIIDKYGPTDFNSTKDNFYQYTSLSRWLSDKKDNKKFRKSLSPISYVNKKNPPILIIHGNADRIVPYQQSVDIYTKLKSLNVKTKLITIESGGHGKFDKINKTEINKEIILFLKEIGIIK